MKHVGGLTRVIHLCLASCCLEVASYVNVDTIDCM